MKSDPFGVNDVDDDDNEYQVQQTTARITEVSNGFDSPPSPACACPAFNLPLFFL